MGQLKIYNDTTPVTLTEDKKEPAIKKLNEMLSNLLCLRDLIQSDILIKTNVWTHLGLNESYHSDLSKMVGYDSILLQEKEERYKEIREKNNEIRELTELLGKGVSPQAIHGALSRYEDILRAWYENEGWHYASIQNLSTYGIIAELSSQLDYDGGRCLVDKEIFNIIENKDKGTEQKIKEGWDIVKDQFHAELLDTDNNKKRFQDLLLSTFPNSRIFNFQGRKNDYNGFSLRIEFFVSYEDLQNLFIQKEKIH